MQQPTFGTTFQPPPAARRRLKLIELNARESFSRSSKPPVAHQSPLGLPVIYLDHNSTTPLLSEVAEAMAPWQGGGNFGNPSSQHQLGRRARQAIEDAREAIARILGARLSGRQPDRLIFTSGGTEANNLAIMGMAGGCEQARAAGEMPGEIVVSAIEHASVARVVELLERRGWIIHRLCVTPAGVVDVDALDERLSPRTRLVSVMLANNETGVLQPVAELARRAATRGVAMHTDAAQVVGKLPVDFSALGVAAMGVAAHKFHGPLGIGALVARHDFEPAPLLFGGFQQDGLRPGTESPALAVGMQAALTAWEREAKARAERLTRLRNRLESGLIRALAGAVIVNGATAPRLPHTSNLALLGIDRQALLMALDLAGVAASTGAACASGSSEVSGVLSAMNCPADVLASSLRFSLGATTTEEEIDSAIHLIARACATIAAGRRPLHA
jgi:cysteine desulfurase